MLAGTFLPLTSKKILVFVLEKSLLIYPIAIGPLTLGPKVPLVTFPISLFFPSNILTDSLAITFVSGFIPTLSFETPSLYCFLINSDPGNSSLILFF